MREIKFRAWDKKSNTMCDVVMAMWKDGKLDTGMIWMQYSGLKDENGKEIYEGDIIHRSWDRDGESFEENLPVFSGLLGMECPTGMYVGNAGRHSLTGNFVHLFNVEVVGNIYENPEFLKGKDGK